jgi:hypothetical protein
MTTTDNESLKRIKCQTVKKDEITSRPEDGEDDRQRIRLPRHKTTRQRTTTTVLDPKGQRSNERSPVKTHECDTICRN